MLNKFMSRWLFSIARELMVEANFMKDEGKNSEALMLVCLAAALNRANGKIIE
jgi:hypothetical protein